MQGIDNTTLDPGASPASRTTAAGLEAWMSGVHAEDDHAPAGEPEPEATATAEIGPVNAAESLVLQAPTTARKLVGPDGAELVVDPEQGNYYFESTSLKPLAALLAQPASAWTPVYSEALRNVRAAGTAQSLERLLWYAGLIATPGILTRRLNRGGHYKLARWPETEREFPRHFRIAKAMLNEPVTAETIADAAGTTLEEVIDYINACHAAGRLEAAQPSASKAGSAAGASRTERLMARLNKPLFAR